MTVAEVGLEAVASARRRVVAVLTAFAPPEALADVVASASLQCERVIVVDNTPAGTRSAEEILGSRPDVTVIRNSENVGLATALRQGIAASGDSEFIFLLDQDSVPAVPIVANLVVLVDEDPRRAVAAPAPWDAGEQRYLDPRTVGRPIVANMAMVITSAMLLRRSAYAQTDGMREEFFVDCVDQDLCLQLRKAGWTIVQDKRLLLPHSLGDTQWHGVGFLKLRATHHPQWRLYWAARNGVILSRQYFRFDTRWATTNLAFLAYWVMTVLLFEPPRWRGVRSMFHGIADGLRGRSDPHFLPGTRT